MKSIKVKAESIKTELVKIESIQKDIKITYKGIKYDFNKVTELNAEIADELIKLNIIREVK